MRQLTEKERKKLRDKTHKELERLEKVMADETTRELLDRFKNRFNLCESCYKVVLSDYVKERDGKKTEYLKITMKEAPSALRYAGYTFDRNLLNRLFGSEKKKNKRSAKILRDSVTHGLNKSAVKEIITRQEQLFEDMEAFLAIIWEE